METARPLAPFEVHCDRCRVTFPLGTRRCIHCGGPTQRAGRRLGLRAVAEPAPEEAAGGELEDKAEDAAALARRRFTSPLTLVWILVIAAGYLARSCAGHSP